MHPDLGINKPPEPSGGKGNDLEAIQLFLAGKNKKKASFLKEYLHDLEYIKNNKNEKKVTRDDIVEAQELIEILIDRAGIYPILTMPKSFWQEIKNKKDKGISAHTTDSFGIPLLAATLGIPPYLPKAHDDRVILQFKPGSVMSSNFEPRFTGKNNAFSGIVVYKKQYIELSDLKEVAM